MEIEKKLKQSKPFISVGRITNNTKRKGIWYFCRNVLIYS